MRRGTLAVTGLLVLAAGGAGAVWIAKRTVRWNDARTMPPPLEAAVRAYAKGDDDAGAGYVAAFLRRYRAPAWEPRARVLVATHLAARGKDGEIAHVLPRELPEGEPLAPLGLLLRARALLARGEPEQAAALAGRALAVPGFPPADEARRIVVAAAVSRGQWRDAVRTLDAAKTPATTVDAARLAAGNGDLAGARRRLVDLALAPLGADDTALVLTAIEETLPDAASRFDAPDRRKVVTAARRLVDENRAQQALDLLDLVRPARAPSAATADESLAEAEAWFKLGRMADARSALARARTGDAGTRDGVRYLEARLAAEAGRYDAYRAGLQTLGRLGSSPWRERALLDLAKAAEGIPSPTTLEAYRRYRIAAGDGADPLALLREGWAAYELGRVAEADAGFARALAKSDAPDGVRITSLYWRARIAEGGGHAAAAREAWQRLVSDFGNHYYGILAAKRVGAPPPVAGTDPPPLADPGRLGPAGRWLAAGRQLASVGLWDSASPSFRAALDGADEASRMTVAVEAAAAARQAGSLADAVAFAQRAVGDRDRAHPDRVPLSLWRLLAPAPSGEAITRAAKESGLPPPLLAAVALQESAFNPLAVSSAGARGLLQVMPAVGIELAARLKLPRFRPDDLFDPETNLRLGSAHLQDYVRRFGSVPSGLAAYNGGPARVLRWASSRADDERFVERIPIPETRIYVKRVLAGARIYSIAWPRGLGVE